MLVVCKKCESGRAHYTPPGYPSCTNLKQRLSCPTCRERYYVPPLDAESNSCFKVTKHNVTIGEAFQDKAKALELCQYLEKCPISEGLGPADTNPTNSKHKRSPSTAESSSKRQKPAVITEVMNQGNSSSSPILEATINGRNVLVRVTPEPLLDAARGVKIRVVLGGNRSEERLSTGGSVAPVAHPLPQVEEIQEEEEEEEEEEEAVNVGQRVEGQFDGEWFPGTITAVGVNVEDGYTMIKIEYDDGDRETVHFPNERIPLAYFPELLSGSAVQLLHTGASEALGHEFHRVSTVTTHQLGAHPDSPPLHHRPIKVRPKYLKDADHGANRHLLERALVKPLLPLNHRVVEENIPHEAKQQVDCKRSLAIFLLEFRNAPQ
ncbi:hypothetical protein THAOC_23749 [Thalassiosira oceanica]|uniref:Tudor domain-containing protein n=1 Tax=Thalassiosira oceanica TaxID=159749 RepID=K0RRE4_THAOC|nr:hypothetical protein THAOC_23749 [Thalassiosira oceanica]|eukprot:EJK56373.1 hypothetical protein THAOC_23749 [Thalassiosira oceanica]